MSRHPIPMTVIGGYLGAGKTTLINQLLANSQGKRLFVLVNDFGEINIDAKLLASRTEDTISLTNGCVCCSMGADLYMAIGRVLDLEDRPDHIIVEASGVADPAAIANAAIAEPDLSYAGIIGIVDGTNFLNLVDDRHIGEQIQSQITCADVVVISKTTTISPQLEDSVKKLNPAHLILLTTITTLPALLLEDLEPNPLTLNQTHSHPDYIRWIGTGDRQFDREALKRIMAKKPAGLFRLKGFVQGHDGISWLVQVVGAKINLKQVKQHATCLVGIGPEGAVNPEECDIWWNNC